MKHLRNWAIPFGLTVFAVYVVLFYATPMPSVPDNTGQPMSRARVLWLHLVSPDTTLFPNWFGAPAQFAIFDRVPILLAAAAIVAWAALLGWMLLAAFRVTRNLIRLETALFATAVGLNILSTWTLVMGLCGHLNRTSLIIVPASLTAVLGYALHRHRSSNSNSRELTAPGAPPSIQHPTDPSEIITPQWLWLGVPFVVAILLAAMLPPLDFDVCEYHLQAPKEFFQQGQISFLPHNVYANMPLGAEMLSLLSMVLVGDWWLGALVGKTLIAVFAPLCALGIFAAGQRLYSTRVGVVASLVYISNPWIADVSSMGLVDGVLACYLFLALYALLLSRESPESESPAAQHTQPTAFVLLAGYLAGAAVATKYPAVLFVLIPLAVWAFVAQYRSPLKNPEPSRSSRVRSALITLTVFLLAASVGCGLWFGKNLAFTGNPTYPLLYSVFGSRTWNADKDQRWNKAHRAHDFSPKRLGEDVKNVGLSSELLSPLVFPLALLAFFATNLRRLRWALLAYVVFFVAAWWLLTHRIDRFLYPVLPVLALLAGLGAYWLADLWWRRTAAIILAIGLASNFLLTTSGARNAWFIPLEQFAFDTKTWTSPWHWYLNNDSTRGGVLTVGEAAVFDLKAPVLYNTCFDDCIFEQLVKDKTPDEIRAELASRHIAYVFVNWDEIARYRDSYGFTDFVQPEVFDRLVELGILLPVPTSPSVSEKPNPEVGAMAYRVVGSE